MATVTLNSTSTYKLKTAAVNYDSTHVITAGDLLEEVNTAESDSGTVTFYGMNIRAAFDNDPTGESMITITQPNAADEFAASLQELVDDGADTDEWMLGTFNLSGGEIYIQLSDLYETGATYYNSKINLAGGSFYSMYQDGHSGYEYYVNGTDTTFGNSALQSAAAGNNVNIYILFTTF